MVRGGEGEVFAKQRRKRTEKYREANVWQRKLFGLRRSKRTEREKEGKWEKLLQSRRLEIEGSRRGLCGPKNWTFTIQGIQFETVTKRQNYLFIETKYGCGLQ